MRGVYSRHRVTLIGVPFGLGGRTMGARLGPAAMRLAEIYPKLNDLVATVVDSGDVAAPLGADAGPRGDGIGHFEKVFANLVAVRNRVRESLTPGNLPLVMGGDHSLALATVAAAVENYGDELGVLWIDAHGDYNTPDTSPSLNLHGMPLALLCGFDCGPIPGPAPDQWRRLQAEFVPELRLNPEHIIWFGLRDPDPGEVERILLHDPRRAITMTEIDLYGLPAMLEHSLEILDKGGVKKLWISFDVDVLDPFIAPGTGTDVAGGLSYREAHLLAELLHSHLKSAACPFDLVGCEIVEVNPVLDRVNETAKMGVEWATSLLGKRVMPPWPEVH